MSAFWPFLPLSGRNRCGWFHALLGDYQEALACCQKALAQQEELGLVSPQTDTWDSLGYINLGLGYHAEAVACYEKALHLCLASGNRGALAPSYTNLGDAHLAAGDRNAARHAWRQALTLLEELDHPNAALLRANWLFDSLSLLVRTTRSSMPAARIHSCI